MKRLSIFIQWVLVLGFLGFAAYSLFRTKPVPDRHPEQWRGWNGFMVLSYPGIGPRDPEIYTSPKHLQKQLEALKEAGWKTITPEDALAFLHENAPLPDKALLLLFEGGRKDSVIYTIKPFQQTGFFGTLCLPSRVMRSRNAFFLRRNDLKRISTAGFWQFAAMGDRAIDEIPVDADGHQGHFLTRRMWTDSGRENLEEYRKRVTEDYDACLETVEEETGILPIAFVYPFADNGSGPEADPEARAINREAVGRFFKMAFVQADNPFNGPGQDPYALNRLRVPGNLSGPDLVQLLNKYAPRQEGTAGIHESRDWQSLGPVRFMDTGIDLSASASIWLRGSDSWSDMDLETTLVPDPDALGAVYARHAAQDQFLRVTATSKGIRVQENLNGKMRTLHWHPVALADRKPVSLRLRLKGNRAWVWLESALIAGPLPLSPELRQGQTGIGAERAPLQVTAFSATPLPGTVLLADNLEDVPADQISKVKAVIAPIRSPEDGPTEEQRRAILSGSAQGTEVIPLLPASGPAELKPQLEALMNHPVTRSLIRRVAIPAPSPQAVQFLHDSDLGVIAILPPGDAEPSSFDPASLSDQDMILVEDPRTAEASPLSRLLATVPAYRVMALQDEDSGRNRGVSRVIRHEP